MSVKLEIKGVVLSVMKMYEDVRLKSTISVICNGRRVPNEEIQRIECSGGKRARERLEGTSTLVRGSEVIRRNSEHKGRICGKKRMKMVMMNTCFSETSQL